MGYPTPPPDYDYAGEKEAHTPYNVPKHVTRDSRGIKVYSSPFALPENVVVLDRAGYEEELEIAKYNAQKKDEKYKLGNFFISYPYQVYHSGGFKTADPGEYVPISGVKAGGGSGSLQALPQLLPYVYFVSEAYDAAAGKFYKYAVACEVSDLIVGPLDRTPTRPAGAKPPDDGLWRNAQGFTVNGPDGVPIENKPGFYPVFDRNGWLVLGPDNQVVYLRDDLVPVYDEFGGVQRDQAGNVIAVPRASQDYGLIPMKDATRAEKLAQKSIYYDSYLGYINRGKKDGPYFEKRGSLGVVYEVTGNGITPPRVVVTRQMIVSGQYNPGFWKRVEKEIGELASDLENFTEGLLVELFELGEEVIDAGLHFLFDHPLLLLALVAGGGLAIYAITK